MNKRSIGGALVPLQWPLGALLCVLCAQAVAQTGPITTQSLFFNTAGSTHRGNYLEADAGLIYADNVALSRNASSDVLAVVGLVGNTSREGAPRFDYHLNSDIALVKYLRSSFQTQPFGYLDANAAFKIVPGTLSWDARETYTQAILNPSVPPTPDNLESLNYFTTGPRLTLRPTLRTTVTADAVYSYVLTSSKSPAYVNIDHHRYGGDLKIERAFSSTFSTYVSGSYDKVQFKDQTLNTDFTQEQGRGGIRFGDARTALDLSGGYTRLLLGKERPSGVNWRASLSRVISPNQRLTVYGLRQITDAANLFRLNLDQPVPSNSQTQLLTGQPFTHREYGATWHLEGTRTVLEVNGITFTDRYAVTPLNNRDAKALNALVTRLLSLSMSWDLGGSYERDDYTTGSRLRTLNLLTSLRWRLGPRLGLRFVLARTSYSPNGFADNQVGVIASYGLTTAALASDALVTPTPLQPTSPAMQPRLY